MVKARTRGYTDGAEGPGDQTVSPEGSSSGPDQGRARLDYASSNLSLPEGAGGEFNSTELFNKLWRRKGLILAIIAICMTTVAIVLFQVTPRYQAESLILIESQRDNLVKMDAVMSGLSGDTESIQSEIEVIQSRPLVTDVITALGLDGNQEFNPTLAPKGLVRKLLDGDIEISSLLPWQDEPVPMISAGPGDAIPADDAIVVQGGEQTINSFIKRLTIHQKGRSRVIALSFTSQDPLVAADVVNALADLYINQLLELKVSATQRATSWLDQRVKVLRQQVEEAEGAVERYRSRSGLIEARGVTMASQQAAELSTQVIIARTERVEAEARLNQALELAKTSGGVLSTGEVLKSPLIQKFREQESNLDRQAAELSQEFGERHPKMVYIRAQMKDLQNKLHGEVGKIIEGLRNEVSIARSREESMKGSLKKVENEVAQSNRAEVELRALEREATASRNLFETFLSRYKETSAQEDMAAQTADARVISWAGIPTAPTYPKKDIILVLAFFASAGISVFIALFLELLDRGFRSSDQVEQATNIPVFSIVPLQKRKTTRSAAVDFIVNNPVSAYSEAIRTLHTSLLLSQMGDPPRRVLITSSQAEEGKTVIAVSFARMLAMAGRRILLIDCDLRRPSVAKSLGLRNEPGLVDVLSGDVALDEAIHCDETTGLFVMPSGKPTQNPTTLFSSEKLARTLDELDGRFDFIIIDSPPVLAVSDSRILFRLVDSTLCVVRWADTSRDMLIAAIKLLKGTNTSLDGIVMSMVDLKKLNKYSYLDGSYGNARISKYYTQS